MSLWRNQLAHLAVDWKVGGLSPSRDNVVLEISTLFGGLSSGGRQSIMIRCTSDIPHSLSPHTRNKIRGFLTFVMLSLVFVMLLTLSSPSYCEISVFSRFSLVNLWNISTKEFPVFFFQVQPGSLIWAHLVLVVSVWNLDLNWFKERKTLYTNDLYCTFSFLYLSV